MNSEILNCMLIHCCVDFLLENKNISIFVHLSDNEWKEAKIIGRLPTFSRNLFKCFIDDKFDFCMSIIILSMTNLGIYNQEYH